MLLESERVSDFMLATNVHFQEIYIESATVNVNANEAVAKALLLSATNTKSLNTL